MSDDSLIVVELRRRVASLEAENAELKNARWLTETHLLCTDVGVGPGHILDRVRKLREIVEALQEDSKRINWLEGAHIGLWAVENVRRMYKTDGTNGYNEFREFQGWAAGRHLETYISFRAAIDAALKASNG